MARPVLGRIVRAEDFDRVLAQRPCARSAHFSLHHLPEAAPTEDLSTGQVLMAGPAVDDRVRAGPRLGLAVPKRHARRAVTRNLLRRQIRAAAIARAASLRAGWWVVRLKAPFDPKCFDAAASAPLRRAARAEIDALLAAAAAR